MKSEALYQELESCLNRAFQYVDFFKSQPIDELNQQPNSESWSALACLDHLNQYATFYLPEIKKAIQTSSFQHQPQFKPGILGNYFANSMRIKNDSVKKMKSPKAKIPVQSTFDFTTLNQFENELQQLKDLIQQSKHVDLSKTTCSISLTPLIKLKLGDTLLFYTLHIQRHLWQANRAMR